jgi:murein DD-endopeptidase MepM/ murein hydrolase activator NlpD
MKIKFALFIFLFGCNSLTNKPSIQEETSQAFELESKNLTKSLYGINIDSMYVETKKIKWGQSFSDILYKSGIDNKIIFDAINKSKNIFNLKTLKRGNEYKLLYYLDKKTPSYFIYEPDLFSGVVYSLEDSIFVDKRIKPIHLKERVVYGNIESSLYETIEKNKFPLDLVYLLVDVFAWQVDFYKINKGDKFKVVYLEEIVDNKVIGIKEIKAAYFYHDNKDYYAFKYDQGKGIDYFDEKGNNLRKTFLRSPLNFSRISSRYSKKRFHPVLKRYKSHLGTDYAAPRGTPIRSVADGVVTEARRNRGNGIYVKIKHNNKYSTQYLHMSKFAKKIKKGVRVSQGQTIGYVGSTGLASGPHVCFRFWKNGIQVDPYKQNDLPPGEPISQIHHNTFEYIRLKYLEKLKINLI